MFCLIIIMSIVLIFCKSAPLVACVSGRTHYSPSTHNPQQRWHPLWAEEEARMLWTRYHLSGSVDRMWLRSQVSSIPHYPDWAASAGNHRTSCQLDSRDTDTEWLPWIYTAGSLWSQCAYVLFLCAQLICILTIIKWSFNAALKGAVLFFPCHQKC